MKINSKRPMSPDKFAIIVGVLVAAIAACSFCVIDATLMNLKRDLEALTQRMDALCMEMDELKGMLK